MPFNSIELSKVYASCEPLNTEVYDYRIETLSLKPLDAGNDDRTDMSFSLPNKMGERAVNFFSYYLAGDEAKRNSRNYNCQTFIGVLNEWQELGNVNPNLYGNAGAARLLEDKYPTADPMDMEMGVSYTITTAKQPDLMRHAFIALDSERIMCVNSNRGYMALGTAVVAITHYEATLAEGPITMFAMTDRPSVMDTDYWEQLIEQRFKHKPHKAARRIYRANSLSNLD